MRKVQTAIDENQRLAGPGRAMDDPVAATQAAGQLLLLQIHDPDNVGYRLDCLDAFGLNSTGGVKQAALLDAYFRKHMPADTVDLRQAQRRVGNMPEHGPEPFLKGFRIDRGRHFVLTDHTPWRKHHAEV